MTLPNKSLTPRSKTTVLTWVLLGSVVLNLFLAGVLVGTVPSMKHKSFGPMALLAPHGEYMVDWMVRNLDPRDAATFRDAFDPQEASLKQAHEHVHQAVKDVANEFEQTPPDPEALQAAISSWSEAKAEVNDVVGKIVQDAYPKLSPNGRHRLAELAQ